MIDAIRLFLVGTTIGVLERPGADPVRVGVLNWCSDLTFSDINNSSLIGYAGRCVTRLLAGYANLVAAGAQVLFDYSGGDYRCSISLDLHDNSRRSGNHPLYVRFL